MSLCPISNEYDFTYTGSRQDDGGQPEELIAVVTKYGEEGNYSVEPYDTRVDNDFKFIAFNDGVYRFELTGGVSGLVMVQDFIVNHNAKRSVSQLVKEDVENMMCGGCDQGCYYELSKALLASADALLGCAVVGQSGQMIEATNALDRIDLVLKGGCPNKLCSGGC